MKIFFTPFLAMLFVTNIFAVTATALQNLGKIQSLTDNSLEKQYIKHELQNLIVDKKMLVDREIIFNIQQRQKLFTFGIKAESLE